MTILNYLFSKDRFGLSALWLSPIEIIYRICLRYILGFSNEILIEKNNIRLCDTWEYAKKATMDVEMRKQFNLWHLSRLISPEKGVLNLGISSDCRIWQQRAAFFIYMCINIIFIQS